MGPRGDEVADLVEDRRHPQQEAVARRQLVQRGGRVKQRGAELLDVPRVARVHLVTACQRRRRLQHLALEAPADRRRERQVGQQAVLEAPRRKPDLPGSERLGQPQVDEDRRHRRIRAGIIDAEPPHAFVGGQGGDLGQEGPQRLEAHGRMLGAQQRARHFLDLVADAHELLHLDPAVLEGDLVEVRPGLLGQQLEQRRTVGIARLHRLVRAVRAEAVTRVALDAAALEQQDPRVAGAHVHHQRAPARQRLLRRQQPLGLHVDQPRLLAVVQRFDHQAAGDMDAVEEDLLVDGLGQDVGADDAVGLAVGHPQFLQRRPVVAQDAHAALDRRAADLPGTEHIPRQRHGLLEEVHRIDIAPFPRGPDHHAHRVRPDVDRGDELGRRVARRGGHRRDLDHVVTNNLFPIQPLVIPNRPDPRTHVPPPPARGAREQMQQEESALLPPRPRKWRTARPR